MTNYDYTLNVKTADIQMGIHRSFTYHRYEPTPYEALDTLFEQYEPPTKSDHVIDFGCGKGRLNFYLADRFGAQTTGIEMNEELITQANANLTTYRGRNKQGIELMQAKAERYEIPHTANRFYFFNPFTIDIFRNVLSNILYSLERTYRPMEIIFYYPAADFVYFMEEHAMFSLKLEVQLEGYEKDPNERFLVYKLSF
ncbi:Trans-aconitate 2-methyltransferase [Bacillus sp. THAF10]|uniref:class I SAM-dependent methyltransferase n=1 Tax=Bacillus sp. THAF10 TaxID=2587848 RepID=UPI0012689F1C|nr:methyltransferase domain-containing protein [Bacillus sp. THAF10]QFT87782.1 Trans-aconitate 2-methyltransferase [Bacillus sp. THAF10]